MVEPTEQYAAVDVGTAVLGGHVVDVVGFAVRRRHGASFAGASAVANSQRDLLFRREQALLVSDIERVAAGIDGDGHGSVHADVAVDDRSGKGVAAVFGVPGLDEAADRVPWPLSFADHDDAYPGLTCPEDIGGVGECPGTDEIDEQVVFELLVAARIVREFLRCGAVGIRDEPGATPPGAQRGGEGRPQPERHLIVENDVAVVLSVLVDPCAQRPLLIPLLEPVLGADRVEDVSQLPGPRPQLFNGRPSHRLIDEGLGCDRPREHGGCRVYTLSLGLTQTTANRIVLGRRQPPSPQGGLQRRVPRRAGRVGGVIRRRCRLSTRGATRTRVRTIEQRLPDTNLPQCVSARAAGDRLHKRNG